MTDREKFIHEMRARLATSVELGPALVETIMTTALASYDCGVLDTRIAQLDIRIAALRSLSK